MVPSRGKRLRTYIAYRVDRYRGTRHTHARALTHTHAHTSTQTHRYSDASSCFPAHPLVTASTATRRGQKAQTGRRVLTDIRQSLDSNGMCVHAWSSCANHITPSYLHTTKYPFVTYPPPNPFGRLSSLQTLLPPRSVGTPYVSTVSKVPYPACIDCLPDRWRDAERVRSLVLHVRSHP